MRTASHVSTVMIVVALVMVLAATCHAQPSAPQPAQAEQVAVEEPAVADAAASRGVTHGAPYNPGVPWPLTVLSGVVVVLLMWLLIYRMFKASPDGASRGIDEVRPRVLIGGMVAVLLLYGFFFTLYHLLGMLPRDDSAAERIPGEYWLFIGQALGILGSLALNVATYYFGSSSSGEDDGSRTDGSRRTQNNSG